MRRTFLGFSTPAVGKAEIRAASLALRSNWITTGPRCREFEKEFGAVLGAPGALALSSCTAALHLALVAAGVSRGSEVVTTPLTFAATANVIEHLGARPVLVDVDADTGNLDPSLVERTLSKKTRAILPVHFAGHPAEMKPLREIAENRRIEVVEDAAHALPAKYEGRAIGSTSNPVAFSFYATKNLTTAEGGMLTARPEFLEKARILSLHGMDRNAWKRYDKGGSWFYEVLAPGFKYNMTDIQASIGLVQLRRLASFQRRRRQIVKAYNKAFAQMGGVLEIPAERSNIEHAWHLYVLRLVPNALKIGRDQFIEQLTKRNIGTSVHFIPIHLHPFYRNKYGYKPNDFPVAYSTYRRSISLPLHPKLSNSDVTDVISAVEDVVRKYRRRA